MLPKLPSPADVAGLAAFGKNIRDGMVAATKELTPGLVDMAGKIAKPEIALERRTLSTIEQISDDVTRLMVSVERTSDKFGNFTQELVASTITQTAFVSLGSYFGYKSISFLSKLADRHLASPEPFSVKDGVLAGCGLTGIGLSLATIFGARYASRALLNHAAPTYTDMRSIKERRMVLYTGKK